jgi:hypothetical protein
VDGWSHLCRSGALGGIYNLLIETVDGRVPSGTHSLEQLIVASNEVASATAQLVAASRVKANLMSKMQERLKVAAKVVTEACKALVKLAYDLGEAGRGGGRGLQIYGGSRAQEARDGAAGRDFAFGEGPGRGETLAGGNASCRVSQGRDRLMSLDYTTMHLMRDDTCRSLATLGATQVTSYYTVRLQ